MDKLNEIRREIVDITKKYGIKIEQIILFGSRARGNFKEGSDWDILIVLSEDLEEKLYWKVYSEIHQRLIEILDSPIDLLMVSLSYFKENEKNIGKPYYWAKVEGITI